MPFEDAVFDAVRRYASVFLRLALGATFLTAVGDRFGLWGPAGAANVAWGDFQHFTAYTAQLNPWAPAPIVPALAWAATVAELVLGIALILGFFTRWSALLSGVLLLLFAFGMTIGTGLKSALNGSVFSAAAAAVALAALGWALDRGRQARQSGEQPGRSVMRAA